MTFVGNANESKYVFHPSNWVASTLVSDSHGAVDVRNAHDTRIRNRLGDNVSVCRWLLITQPVMTEQLAERVGPQVCRH